MTPRKLSLRPHLPSESDVGGDALWVEDGAVGAPAHVLHEEGQLVPRRRVAEGERELRLSRADLLRGQGAHVLFVEEDLGKDSSIWPLAARPEVARKEAVGHNSRFSKARSISNRNTT